MSVMSKPKIKLLSENLRKAAYELAQAAALEAEQIKLDNTLRIEEAQLNQVLKDAMYEGALTALMESSFVRGNQSKSAEIMGMNRATLRTYLKRVGLLEDSASAKRAA